MSEAEPEETFPFPVASEKLPEVCVSLVMSCAEDRLAEITQLLGEPDEIWKRGEPNHARLPFGLHEDHGCRYGSLDCIDCLDVSSFMQRVVERIRGKGRQLLELGFETQLSVVIYSYDRAPMLGFEADTLGILVEARATVDFDLYNLRERRGRPPA